MNSEATVVRFSPAPPLDVQQGLLGFVVIEVGGAIAIEGVAVRRARGGRVYLAFPTRELRCGGRLHIVRPLTADARRDIERQVIDALRAQGRIAS